MLRRPKHSKIEVVAPKEECEWDVDWIYSLRAVTNLIRVYFMCIVGLNKLLPSQKRLLHWGRCLIFL